MLTNNTTPIILFFSLIFAFAINNCHGAQAPVCTGVHFTMNVSRQVDNVAVFIYSADISLSIADNIHTIITLDNHTSWSLDSSQYYQFEPAQYWDIEQGMVQCPTLNGTCNLTAFDSAGWYEIPLSLLNQTLFPAFTDFLVFDQGSVFFDDGTLFDPNGYNCAGSEEIVIVGPAYNTNFNYCCNHYEYVNIPDNPCVEFDGNTTFYDKSSNAISSFSAKYLVISGGMNVTVNDYSMPAGSYYDFIPNYGFDGCYGSSTPTCNFLLEINPGFDYQFDMFLSIYDETQTYGTTIAGKVLQRNGVLVRHRDEAYTPTDPCWVRTFPSSSDGGRAVNSFCCTKFSQQSEIQKTIREPLFPKIQHFGVQKERLRKVNRGTKKVVKRRIIHNRF